jgi:putative hydrolase of the HAD superfamily
MALVDKFAGVIFDYGGVLAFHQTIAEQNKLAQLAGLTPEVFQKGYWSDRGPYDKGLITAEDYWNDIAAKGNTKFSADQLLKLIEADNESWMKFDTEMYAFVNRLRTAGKRVAVLSNMPHELGEVLKTADTEFGFAPFDHITLSYEIRSIKPEAAIYEHCLAGLGVPAADTLFLDDRPENIEGAKRLGIHGIQFTSREDVLPGLIAG